VLYPQLDKYQLTVECLLSELQTISQVIANVNFSQLPAQARVMAKTSSHGRQVLSLARGNCGSAGKSAPMDVARCSMEWYTHVQMNIGK
ncbi:hypothetical protein IAQ61_002061, partial [Plenodomus lingam]